MCSVRVQYPRAWAQIIDLQSFFSSRLPCPCRGGRTESLKVDNQTFANGARTKSDVLFFHKAGRLASGVVQIPSLHLLRFSVDTSVEKKRMYVPSELKKSRSRKYGRSLRSTVCDMWKAFCHIWRLERAKGLMSSHGKSFITTNCCLFELLVS
jgi:hypothetical protein